MICGYRERFFGKPELLVQALNRLGKEKNIPTQKETTARESLKELLKLLQEAVHCAAPGDGPITPKERETDGTPARPEDLLEPRNTATKKRGLEADDEETDTTKKVRNDSLQADTPKS